MNDDGTTSNASREAKILVLIPILPSIISILSSSILILIVRRNFSNQQAFHRILLGVAISDIIFCFVVALELFLVPKSSGEVWAIGNDQSCVVMGFFTQLSLLTIFYSSFQHVYFACIIIKGLSDSSFATRIELWGHLITIGYPLVSAIAGLAVKAYGHSGDLRGCWLVPTCRSLPDDQPQVNCTSELVEVLLCWLPLGVFYGVTISSNVLIFVHVRRTIRKSRRVPSSATVDSQEKRIRAVAAQSFSYVTAALLTFSWPLASRILYKTTSQKSIVLLYFSAFFLPLWGFWNILVYLRPRYCRARAKYPEQSRLWALHRAAWGASVLPADPSSRSSPLKAASLDQVVERARN